MRTPLTADVPSDKSREDYDDAAAKVPAAALWMVLLTVFLDQFGGNVLVPMLAPYARRDFQASDGEIGYLFSFPSASAFAFSYVLAHITNKLGRKPVFLMSLLGMSIAALCQGLAKTFDWLLLGRTFGGMWLTTMTTAKVYINEATDWDVTGSERSYWFAQMSLCQNTAKLFAPALGGALSHYGLNVPSLATSVTSLVGAILVFVYVVESPYHGKVRAPVKRSKGGRSTVSTDPKVERYRRRAFCLASSCTTACMKLSQTVFALFAIDKYGLRPIDIGFVYLFGALGTILMSRFVPRANGAFGPYRSGIFSSVMHGLSMFLLPLWPAGSSTRLDSVEFDDFRHFQTDFAWRCGVAGTVSCFVLMSAFASTTTAFQNIVSGELQDQPTVQSKGFQSRQGSQILVPILASQLFKHNLDYPWFLGAFIGAAAAIPLAMMRIKEEISESPQPSVARSESAYGEDFTVDTLSDAEVLELGHFMKEVLVKKHLKWSKDRHHVERLLERSIPEMPISDRRSYYEALIQYST